MAAFSFRRICRGSVAVLFVGALGAISLCASDVPAAKSTVKAPELNVHWQPTAPVNGSPIILRVTSQQRLTSLSGKWLGHEVFFSSDSHGKVWYGFAGASLETRPGSYPLELDATISSNKDISLKKRITISKGHYHSIVASVPKQYTEPNSEQVHKIGEDKTLKEHAFAHVTPEQEWAGSFRPPVKAQISDVFGTSRTFNGKVQSTHQGLDYAVPEGTPVAAVNAGTVLLARPLFFEGNCVVLDHGQGLLTLYMHLSKIEVKEGDHVTTGQTIAVSGGTGRATGPHLHVAVRWQGVYLNPATLLSLKLP
ncbi:MAG TPA: M23 family metallopeptidase [Terriglobales bacterium]|jgi:murein DD-endopeptidase MepM/ murein hydrolase activator NlpD|nr:M23 family metallopeptidase [Terriglobales bacterium]